MQQVVGGLRERLLSSPEAAGRLAAQLRAGLHKRAQRVLWLQMPGRNLPTRYVTSYATSARTRISYIGDLTTWETADGLMTRAKEEYGRIDGLANIAGGNTRQKSFWLWDPKEMEWDFAINFWTTMWCCRAVLPIMLEQGSGSIVNIATHGVVGKLRVPYAAGKGGNIALATSISREVAEFGVRVNVVAPSGTFGPDRGIPRERLFQAPAEELPEEEVALQARYRAGRIGEVPMGRAGLPEEQASAIAFLLSDDASYITGQVLPVGGGQAYPF